MGFLRAVQFLTIVPAAKPGGDTKQMGQALVYFPVVGLALGLVLLGLDRVLSLGLPFLVVNALLIVALIILTGALHLDGFVDTCDGMAAHRPAQQRLDIMSDSHVGAYGVIGACALLLLKYVALISVPDGLRLQALLLMPVAGRWAMAYAIFAFPYARTEGLGAAFKQQARWYRLAIGTAIALAIGVSVAHLAGAILLAAIWLLATAVSYFFKHRLGGLTGDTYGAINELSEVTLLLLLPLAAGLPGF